MRLLSLNLKNFKGHKNLNINFGNVTKISGANGTGKTSVFDAFCWALTGKDSQGRVCGTGQKGEATIRPRRADGELVHDVEISVTARLLDDDGEVHTLQRIFCEQYSTDKNSGNKIFKGNTTKYFVNEVPAPANKYDDWVKGNIDPERLRLTGDPAFFPTMPWQDQRKWLLQISGDVMDADVIAADPELKPMENLLTKHSLDDIKAMATAQLKLANKAVKENVIRIDQTVALAGNATEADLTAQIARQDEMVKAQQEAVARAEVALVKAETGGRAAQLQNELDTLKVKIESWEQRRHNKLLDVRESFRRKALQLQAELERKEAAVDGGRHAVTLLEEQIREMISRRDKMYAEYDAVKAREFSDTECPFCHQPLQPEKLEELRAQFNTEKAKTLERIVAAGKKHVCRISDTKMQKDVAAKRVADDEKAVEDLQKQLGGIHDEEKAALEALPQLEDVKDFREVRAKRDAVARELADLNRNEMPDLAPLQAELDESRNILKSLFSKKSELQANLKTLQALASLQDDLQRQRENADASSATLSLVGLFIQTKCRMVTERVNTLFPGLEWRLFTKNISNDDVVETCELTMHGVGYRDLSQGEKIRAGLIIVDTLQEKLGVRNPVWIDGAESITFTPNVKSQLVLLKAQENSMELKIEEER